MKTVAAAMTLAAYLMVAPAAAHADAVPTVDEVVAVLAGLTDPNIPAANKTNIVTPGFSPDEAGTIDDHLNRMNAAGLLPLNFVVADIQPAPGNFAGATVAVTGSFRQTSPAGPVVMVNQGGRWLMTHDTAWTAEDAIWSNANRHFPGFVPVR
jgi:hypothetical protein